MKLIITDSEFLYEVQDIPYNLLNKVKIIADCNNIYLKIKEKLDTKEMMELMENSAVIYDK